MDGVSWYVMSSSWVFLVGWVVMLLVVGAAVFRSDRGKHRDQRFPCLCVS
jgi:hypothetical protein